MRATYSKRAKETLDNPEAVRQLMAWLDDDRPMGRIKSTASNGDPKTVQVRKAGTMYIVRAEEPFRKHWLNMLRGLVVKIIRVFN